MQVTKVENGYLYRCPVCGWKKKHPAAVVMNCRICRRRPKPDPRLDLAEPSLMAKAVNFGKATAKHVAAGRPLATDDQVAERWAICQACEIFKPKSEGQGVCTHPSCGCALKAVGLTGKNKLRWGDSVCPLGKWGALPPAPPAD